MHFIVEDMAICSYEIVANKRFVYIHVEYAFVVKCLETVIAFARL